MMRRRHLQRLALLFYMPILLGLASFSRASVAAAFMSPTTTNSQKQKKATMSTTLMLSASMMDGDEQLESSDIGTAGRRSFVGAVMASTFLASSSAVAAVKEPSISYKDFCNLLQKGDVEFVEFIPNGNKAYATIKVGKMYAPAASADNNKKANPMNTKGWYGDKDKAYAALAGTLVNSKAESSKPNGNRILIGEGYPAKSYSFAVKKVQDANVPFKLIVPGLEKYSK